VYGRFSRLMLRLHRSSSVRDDTEWYKGLLSILLFIRALYTTLTYTLAMFPANSLLSLLLVALALGGSVTATPTPRDSKVTLTFARNINITGSTIAEADRARARVLQSLGLTKASDETGRAASFSATNAVVRFHDHLISDTVMISVFSIGGIYCQRQCRQSCYDL